MNVQIMAIMAVLLLFFLGVATVSGEPWYRRGHDGRDNDWNNGLGDRENGWDRNGWDSSR
ncbi:hypothetical protein DPMN_059727 [Dreissena polymorpha]|uniref:Uncharacterized protein n=1 Tax=Dreissena polymorpha TaxID=45954 RepID=A0A9D4HHI2_DREPO|nr:hypothetical protein DPMN_059727 [Dreissena polymorpha]